MSAEILEELVDELVVNVIRIPLMEDVESEKIIDPSQDDSLAREIADAEEAYLLTWTGRRRVPVGATVGNHVVKWTRLGRVIGDDGTQIGTYQRVTDVIGPKYDKKNAMLVFPFQQRD